MQVKILGSAAGGGFPQWNCVCPNCHALRSGQFTGKARLQTQLAVSADGESWFLLGASPDLRFQIEGSPELHPRSEPISGSRFEPRPEPHPEARPETRSSPIRGVVLASADLDHVLGLLLLRELQPFQVWAAGSTMELLRGGNSMFAMLNRVPDQVRWNVIRGGEPFSLESVAGEGSGIECRAVALSSRHPAYAAGHRPAATPSGEAVLGLILTAPSGAKVGFFPQVPALTAELRSLWASLDCLLLDGTFWCDDELIQLQGSGQSARDMGHVPVGGEDGSLHQLGGLTRPRRMYIHINNTNPMLNEAGAEFHAVRAAGWELAEDGCHLTF